MAHGTVLYFMVCSTLVGCLLILTNSFFIAAMVFEHYKLIKANHQNVWLFSNFVFGFRFAGHVGFDTVLILCCDGGTNRWCVVANQYCVVPFIVWYVPWIRSVRRATYLLAHSSVSSLLFWLVPEAWYIPSRGAIVCNCHLGGIFQGGVGNLTSFWHE